MLFFFGILIFSLIILIYIVSGLMQEKEKRVYYHPVIVSGASSDLDPVSSTDKQSIATNTTSYQVDQSSDQNVSNVETAYCPGPLFPGWKVLVWYLYPKSKQNWTVAMFLHACDSLNIKKDLSGKLIFPMNKKVFGQYMNNVLGIAHVVPDSKDFAVPIEKASLIAMTGAVIYGHYRSSQQQEAIEEGAKKLALVINKTLDFVLLDRDGVPLLLESEDAPKSV